MWAKTSQHKKQDDPMSSYNSLKDPHLNSYFRKPQIRSHLLKANIINNENKIVEEISTTKHRQDVERKQKRELYQMLDQLVKQSNRQTANQVPETRGETILDRLIFDQTKTSSYENTQRQLLLHKLDRMIKVIKEHNESKTTTTVPVSNKQSQTLRPSKSMHDISLNSDSPGAPSSSVSTPQLAGAKNSRPKSSYGRSRSRKRNEPLSRPNSLLKKCPSLNNVKFLINSVSDDELEEDIKSLDGESLDDTSEHHDYHLNSSPAIWAIKSGPSLISPEVENNYNKKYYAFEKRFIRTRSLSGQRVRMTLRYNGLTEATNRGNHFRNIRVNQQITIGGNSILIYDGSVKPGETFTFDIRPHMNNSFAITVLVNGIRDLRLNTCCEHKHRPGTRLAHFTIIDIVGGRPCFSCQMMTEQILSRQPFSFNSDENNKDVFILGNNNQEQKLDLTVEDHSNDENYHQKFNGGNVDDNIIKEKNNEKIIFLKPPWEEDIISNEQYPSCLVEDIDDETIPQMLTSDSEQEDVSEQHI